jgi:hypothetical protein
MQGAAQFLGVPAVAQTLDRLSYGEPLTTGAGMTTRVRPEALEAAMALAPLYRPVGMAAKEAVAMTKGLPVGMGIKDVSAPQAQALRLAQQRAALPVEQGGLGLAADNTAQQRAMAMGFDTPALHGSGSPDIQKFDPNLVGTKAGNAFDNYMWATSSPEAAAGYALNTNQFAKLPETIILNEKINLLSKEISKAANQGNFDQVGDLRKDLSVLIRQKSKLYKDFETDNFVSEGSTIYPVVLRGQEFMPYEAGGKSWMKANKSAIDESQTRGFQGVAIKNVKDNPNQTVGDIVANTYATENPDLIRSRFAAFDPFRRTAAIAATMGVAAPDLLAAEQAQQKEYKNEMRKLMRQGSR